MPTLIRTEEIPWSPAYLIVGVAWVWGCMAVPLLAVWFAFIDLGGWPLNDDPFYAKPVAYWAAGNGIQWARQGGALTASSVTHVLTGMLSVIGREFSYRPLFLVCIAQQSFGAATLYFIAKSLRLSFGMAVLASSRTARTSFPTSPKAVARLRMRDRHLFQFLSVTCICGY